MTARQKIVRNSEPQKSAAGARWGRAFSALGKHLARAGRLAAAAANYPFDRIAEVMDACGKKQAAKDIYQSLLAEESVLESALDVEYSTSTDSFLRQHGKEAFRSKPQERSGLFGAEKYRGTLSLIQQVKQVVESTGLMADLAYLAVLLMFHLKKKGHAITKEATKAEEVFHSTEPAEKECRADMTRYDLEYAVERSFELSESAARAVEEHPLLRAAYSALCKCILGVLLMKSKDGTKKKKTLAFCSAVFKCVRNALEKSILLEQKQALHEPKAENAHANSRGQLMCAPRLREGPEAHDLGASACSVQEREKERQTEMAFHAVLSMETLMSNTLFLQQRKKSIQAGSIVEKSPGEHHSPEDIERVCKNMKHVAEAGVPTPVIQCSYMSLGSL
ncbi:uncharacterized protein NEMAJ01_1262 [Nematocida major]|uniref:uncharacterized protein n=1 Tax=Nematocida major TaxID=1912982 RepID=UPI002007BBBF|nr:uncharacterized protein NEMAJ01_1262 [Nematocida major]KAH9386366.1 hypothetical protein NEMAJ01_1262 [Nematocida major]